MLEYEDPLDRMALYDKMTPLVVAMLQNDLELEIRMNEEKPLIEAYKKVLEGYMLVDEYNDYMQYLSHKEKEYGL
jgi:hypothetical protein